MRILMINDYGRPNGGAELQMLALRDGLRARGHQVRLMASDAELVPGYPLLADAVCRGRTGRGQVLSQVANPSAMRVLRQELRDHPPDIVHLRMFLWQISPAILPLLRAYPVLFQAAVYKAICPNGMKLLPDGRACEVRAGAVCRQGGCVAPATWAATMAQLRILNRWRHVLTRQVALSRTMARTFHENGWTRMGVLGNGIDMRPGRPPLEGPPVVAYAGRLSREKGVGVLIDAVAAADMPGLGLLIAGTGPEEAALRSRAAPLGDRVAFLGHLPRDEMERRFEAAWVQVVPSLWHEPFGNVTTEAMMRGTAVVASDMGGQSDLVRDGATGFLVPPGDAALLADRLGRLLRDRALAEAMGAEGRRIAIGDYARDAVLDRLEAEYRGAIAAFVPPGARGVAG